MSKKVLAAGILVALVVAVTLAGFAMAPSTAIQPIAADSPCPATGCASGACHGFDAVPEPDGVHEMVCPEAGCASVECHGWDSLIGRYHQASDMSLNVWILMPVALVLGLWLLVRRMGRTGRARDDSGADGGMAEASAPVASPERHCAENLMTASEEEVCYEA
ncbi:hypothetical protein [Adlercreutzia equolifaciens]|uniref:hypothetical protein n=1 Tax=Adlercreutzia equolifaciens TaxID=446660 RepID=UPI00266B6303|nr:hypothetical protein [Adlercreutzia equolifaciens]